MIKKVTSDDIHLLAGSLSAAFRDNPFTSWILRQDSKKDRARNLFFSNAIELSLPFNTTLAVENGNSVLVYYPPEKHTINLLTQIILTPKIIQCTGLNKVRRLLQVIEKTNKMHPTEKHFYWQFLGTHPKASGNGFATKIVKEALKQSDFDQLPVYLECTRKELIGFFGQFGFEVINEFDFGQNSPIMHGMFRQYSSNLTCEAYG